MDADATAAAAAPTTMPEAAACSICLDPVVRGGERSVAELKCGHQFHLDCIGSAFNAKGKMQCPNCRNIGQGNWQTTNELQPSSDSHSDLSNQWLQYPDGPTPVTSVFQSDVQVVFDGTEARNSETEQTTIPLGDFLSDTTTGPFVFDVPRSDGSNQRRWTHPTPQSGSSSVPPFGSSPVVTSTGHVVWQAVHLATRSSPYPATARRNRGPRALSIASSILQHHTQLWIRNLMTFLMLELQMWKTITFPIKTMSLDVLKPYPHALGWDNQGRGARWGTASSVHNQAYTSSPSRSTREEPPVSHSENGYRSLPPDRMHPSQ